MKSKLRIFVIKVFGQTFFNIIFYKINRLINREKNFIKINPKYVEKIQEYKVKNKETFFGYYDINPLSPDKEKLLTLVVDDTNAEIGYFELESKSYFKITTTRCWNWQMGSRLRWLDNEKVLFNDFDGEHLISRVCSLKGKEIERYSEAFFDVDMDRKCAYYLDFITLHHYRPGYGYNNIPFEPKSLNEQGLFYYDLNDNKKQLILSIEYINKMFPTEFDDTYRQYINHICVNPYNGYIMFFQIWVKENRKDSRHSRIIVCDKKGNIVKIIDDFNQVSHYWWKTDEDIILTVINNKNEPEYRLYNILNGKYEIIQNTFLNEDGHPSYIKDDLFVTDTYPNKNGMQKLYLCEEKGKCNEIINIYHVPQRWGERRCDLHPQYIEGLIHIDNNRFKKRSQIIIFLKGI